MLPPERPDRIDVAFDDPRLVANAGLVLPITLAGRLGVSELVHSRLDLGDAPGRANPGDRILTLVASALAGATASTTLMRRVPVGPDECWDAWSRRRPPWERSFAASDGAMCDSWIG